MSGQVVKVLLFCQLTATTHDKEMFSFHTNNSPCHGFEEVLACYRKIVPKLKLSGTFVNSEQKC